MAAISEILTYGTMTARIVHDVFETMLRYELRESSDNYQTPTNAVTSATFLDGAWKGAPVVECSGEQAQLFTEKLIGISLHANIDDDVHDAMGEIVNMIGGNVKSVLPKGVSLSMQSVFEGPDHAYRICGSNQNARFSFRDEAGLLWVGLFKEPESVTEDCVAGTTLFTKPGLSPLAELPPRSSQAHVRSRTADKKTRPAPERITW